MKPQPQRFRVRRFCIVNPTYPAPDDLSSAARELTELKKMFPKASVVSPADLATVQSEVFGRNDVNVLHFSGHGDYSGCVHWCARGNTSGDCAPARFTRT